MKIFFIILVALVYLVGILTIQWLDEILPEHLKKNPLRHYSTLIIMWLFTPLMIIGFIIRLIFRKPMDHDGE